MSMSIAVFSLFSCTFSCLIPFAIQIVIDLITNWHSCLLDKTEISASTSCLLDKAEIFMVKAAVFHLLLAPHTIYNPTTAHILIQTNTHTYRYQACEDLPATSTTPTIPAT